MVRVRLEPATLLFHGKNHTIYTHVHTHACIYICKYAYLEKYLKHLWCQNKIRHLLRLHLLTAILPCWASRWKYEHHLLTRRHQHFQGRKNRSCFLLFRPRQQSNPGRRHRHMRWSITKERNNLQLLKLSTQAYCPPMLTNTEKYINVLISINVL